MQRLSEEEITPDNITYLEYAKLKCLCQNADSGGSEVNEKNKWEKTTRGDGKLIIG